MKEMILITGVPRSGTSMTAGIIERCGAFGGVTRPPNSNNKKGMYENTAIVSTVMKPYLQRMNCDPLGQKPLPDLKKLLPFPKMRDEMEAVFISEGGMPHSIWYYKGAKMALFWPVVYQAFPKAKWIVVRRKDENIISSCMRTNFMKAYDTEEGWQGYINYHKERFAKILQFCNAKEVWTEDLIDLKFDKMKEIVDWCGLQWNDSSVREFIEPSLYTKKT